MPMPDHEIEIFFDGQLRYSNPILHARRGSTIRWICKTHDYAVQFANNAAPFELPVSTLSQSKNQPTESLALRANRMRNETYKYTVAVYDNGRIIMDDPIIIIDDEGS